MRIELNSFVITQLTDGRYKATDGLAVFTTFDLDLAIAFAKQA